MRDFAQTDRLRLVLYGRLRLLTGTGADLTPRGAKAQAVLALLATSPDMCRSRRWLEQKLWSDRGTEQASASLRQALSEIRRALTEGPDILYSDRQKVALLANRVSVDDTRTDGAEFLEGLDVRDPDFDHWLRSERLRRLSLAPVEAGLLAAPQPAPAPQKAAVLPTPPLRRPDRRQFTILLLKSRSGSDALSLMEDLFIDAVALSLREALGVTVFTKRQVPELPNTIAVTVQALSAQGNDRFIRARAMEVDTGRLIWSGRSGGLGPLRGPEDPGLILFANQTVEVLGDAISLQVDGNSDLDSLVLQRLAVRKLWTMNPDRLDEAERLLALSDEMKPRGLNAARRAQLRVLQMIEQHKGDPATLRDEAMAFCRIAMEREPTNSMVLAVVAYVRCAIDDAPVAGAEMARRSVRMNPNNPLAWDSLSYAKLHAGQIAEAHQIALKVQEIGSVSPNKFWWDMGLCLTAAVVGDPKLALQMAESAAIEAPDFRAAQRYVIALAAGMDRPDMARAAARRLAQMEPGFSLDALALDPAYPVGVLRRAGLLQSDRILGLGEP